MTYWSGLGCLLTLLRAMSVFLFLSSNKVSPCLTLCWAGEQWLDWKSILGLGPGQVNNGWTGKVSRFWSRAGGQRVGILIQRLGSFVDG